MALEVLPKLMCSTIVKLSQGVLHASLRALNGYCALHRLMIHFTESYPKIRAEAARIVREFIDHEHCRLKKAVPALGEYLPLLTVVDIGWDETWRAYLDECFTRNVRWLLKKYPDLEQLDGTIRKEDRLERSFKGSIVSYRLLLFNVYFLRNIARPHGLALHQIADAYDARDGFAHPEQEELLQQKCMEIQHVSTWGEFLDDIQPSGSARLSEDVLVEMLEGAIRKSAERGYHKPSRSRSSTSMTKPHHSGSRGGSMSRRSVTGHKGGPGHKSRGVRGKGSKTSGKGTAPV
eukprot:TRINITY_DN6063_c0_g1_i2.p1 TRINITY_DN6063_c0_g1~~TRINITY_DN6063_c0_g1_i2.p1  ORF type:complete len:291 (-),score=16.70 TRINITY_DN6063_c0_g1_i2:54-926(-)